MCRNLFLLLAAVLVISAVATTEAANISKREVDNTVHVTTEATESETEVDLDTKMQTLKEKVADLVKQGIDTEKAFLGMAEKVRQMDDKVKNMIERLKKVNSADYLNGDVKNLS